MISVAQRYERLVLQEDSLLRQLHACDEINGKLLELAYAGPKPIHRQVVEMNLLFLVELKYGLQVQLAQVQLDKSMAARQMRDERASSIQERFSPYLLA